MRTLDTEADIRRIARRRVARKMGFYIHALVFVLVNGGLYVINNMTNAYDGGVRWHHFPLFGWGLGLAIHGIVTFVSLQGMDLREHMMEKEMQALRRRQQGQA